MAPAPSPEVAGKLLVAEPLLGDPNFERTVVLVVEHTAEGAFGVVLNRPTDLLVAEVLDPWGPLASDPAVIHVGGPVEERSGWCLALVADPHDVTGFVPVVGRCGLLDLESDAALLHGTVTGLRVYAGYSGWGPGQLDAELADDAWFVVDADPTDPFLPDTASLWSRILGRQRGELGRLAHFPPDVRLN